MRVRRLRQITYHDCERKGVASADSFDPYHEPLRAGLGCEETVSLVEKGSIGFRPQHRLDLGECCCVVCRDGHTTLLSCLSAPVPPLKLTEVAKRYGNDSAVSERGIACVSVVSASTYAVSRELMLADKCETGTPFFWDGCSYEIRKCI